MVCFSVNTLLHIRLALPCFVDSPDAFALTDLGYVRSTVAVASRGLVYVMASIVQNPSGYENAAVGIGTEGTAARRKASEWVGIAGILTRV